MQLLRYLISQEIFIIYSFIFKYFFFKNKNEFSAKAPPAPTKPPASFATPPKFNEVTEADFMDIYTTQPDFDS